MPVSALSWLPGIADWRNQLKALELKSDVTWEDLVRLSRANLDFLATDRLSQLLQKHFANAPPPEVATSPVRLAILSSSTVVQLQAGLRVAALRRGMWITIYEVPYGQYLQELLDESSGLYDFKPTAVLITLDAHHLTDCISTSETIADAESSIMEVLARMRQCWRITREKLKAQVIQQTALPIYPPILGNNEYRLHSSPAAGIERLNHQLRAIADEENIDLLALDIRALADGIFEWHDPMLWHRAKQEVHPKCAPIYGDLALRIIAAQRGLSSKCLVLDLDNTLWGGVVGDDGVDGIVLGQGSALGEAFVSVQKYALALSKRGIILAVCSKNDMENALAPFERHPEMILTRKHIASFIANWDDKATNLRLIARELNIGLDSLVFVDDNPFERNLVRKELPEVIVLEIPDDDPSLIPYIISDSGCFEGISVTSDDRERTSRYQANLERAHIEASATDLNSYLLDLKMQLVWGHFSQIDLSRITQLVNKTNQFNLRTRRYTEAEIASILTDSKVFGLQMRLIDRFGDNGIIGIVIYQIRDNGECFIDTWLMSCRVLGRGVEEATLNIVAQEALRSGATRIIGEYIPTKKNSMVARHYEKLGFEVTNIASDGGSINSLLLLEFKERDVPMHIRKI